MTTTTLDLSTTVAAWLDAEQDRKQADAALAAARSDAAAQIKALENALFGRELTDAERLTYTRDNALPLPGSDLSLHYRDYGRCALANVVTDLLAWIGATKTIKVSRIKAEYERLRIEHTKPAPKGLLA